jgi:hypothetical protein
VISRHLPPAIALPPPHVHASDGHRPRHRPGTDITSLDITGTGAKPKDPNNPFLLAALWLKQSVGDPMFVVRATKQ